VTSNPGTGPPEKLRAARACQRVIGRELRQIYDDVVHEPVPNELLELLRGIDAAPPHAAPREVSSETRNLAAADERQLSNGPGR